MYGILTYMWVIFGVNVGKYSIHGSYGYSQKGFMKKYHPSYITGSHCVRDIVRNIVRNRFLYV